MGNMGNYEIMAIFSPAIGESNLKKQVDELKELIKSKGGEITAEDVWGLKEFAYTIKKHDSGYYVVLNFNMPSINLKMLEKPLNLTSEILRYLVTKTPADYKLKSLDQYSKEAEKEAKAKEDEKEAAKTPVKKDAPAKPAVRKAPEKKAPTEDFADKKIKEEKKSKEKLAEVDEKLKNIINDPDISL